MSDPKPRPAPATIAGVVIISLLSLSILSTACLVIYRRRLPVRTRTPTSIFHPGSPDLDLDLEKSAVHSTPRRASTTSHTPKKRCKLLRKPPPALPADLNLALARAATAANMDLDLEKDMFSPADHGASLSASTCSLGATISPSRPRVFTVETAGGGKMGVEVRVTPPTPNLGASVGLSGVEAPGRSEFSMRQLIMGSFGFAVGTATSRPHSQTLSGGDSKWWLM